MADHTTPPPTAPAKASKRVVLFGASNLGLYAAPLLARDYEIVGFLDNDRTKWGGKWAGHPIHAPEFVREAAAAGVDVIITSTWHEEIGRQLVQLGVGAYSVFSAPPQVRAAGPAAVRPVVAPKGLASASPARRAPDMLDKVAAVRMTFGETLANIRALGHRPGTVIDVGVAFGTPELYRAFSDSPLLMIEPLEEFRPHMEKIAAERPGTHFIVAAAGAADGEMEMSVTPDKSTSSLRVFANAEKRKIPVVRVDAACRQFNAAPPYALKVDVQGAELVVMAGATGILAETLVVVLETSFWGNADVPDISGVITYMKERGFVPYDIVGGHNRPLDWARAQADIVFVQDKGPLRADRRWCTSEQREEFLNAKRARASFAAIMKKA